MSDKREALRQLADRLSGAIEDAHEDYVYVSAADAQFLASALNGYFSGRKKSLDEALGVTRGRGAPKRGPMTKAIRDIVSKAMFRGPDKSWKDISDETGHDPRTLQRLVERHSDAVNRDVASRLTARLQERDKAKK